MKSWYYKNEMEIHKKQNLLNMTLQARIVFENGHKMFVTNRFMTIIATFPGFSLTFCR